MRTHKHRKQRKTRAQIEKTFKTPLPNVYTKEWFRGETFPTWTKQALSYLNPKPKERILDIGCGKGEIIRECTRRGSLIVGLDYSSDAIELSKMFCSVIKASATNLPFRNQIFDAITLIDVVEHLDENDVEKCIKEIRRTIRKDGRVLAHTPNAWFTKTFRAITIAILRIFFDPTDTPDRLEFIWWSNHFPYLPSTHVNERTPTSLSRVFSKHGFDVRTWFKIEVNRNWKLLFDLLSSFYSVWCLACLCPRA